ncbi:tape measure protein [Aureimonas sp. AU40]|uniref:tape measure protein n=1 Tax=Aureimonas sp. AU40 TaxID=1637747 RepID=UPI00078654F1|nr:tape measure protein [Aureimonas sp. AU40]
MKGITVELELADGSFTTRMLRAGQTVQQFNRVAAGSNQMLQRLAASNQSVISSIAIADRNTKGFVATLRDVSIVTGAVTFAMSAMTSVAHGWVGAILEVNAEFERLTHLMAGMSKSENPFAEASNNVEVLIKKAKEVPFTLKSVTDNFVKLKATGTDPFNGSLDAIMDGIAAFGGSDQHFNRATVAISQMMGKGVIQMEELRQQLGESVPSAIALMARSMGLSMGQLIKAVGTGTVESKRALEMLYAEMDRTFGGRANAMMDTFMGQLKQTETLFQTLARTTGDAGFMDEMKKQLLDLNQVLGSSIGTSMAQTLGRGLTTIVQGFRSVIDNAIEFRGSIERLGKALLTVFGAKLVFAGIGQITTAFGALRASLTATGVQFGVASQQIYLYNVAVNSGAAATTLMARGTQVLLAGVSGLAMGITAVMPWLTALGFAVYAVGEYFDLFGNKAKDAYKELEQFGARSREAFNIAATAADAQVGKLEKQIAAINKAFNAKDRDEVAANWMERYGSIGDPEAAKQALDRMLANYDAQIDPIKKKIEEIRGVMSKGETQLLEDEERANLQAFQTMLDKEITSYKAAYDKRAVQISEESDAQIQSANETGRTLQAITKERQEKTLANQLGLYKREEDFLRAKIAEEAKIITESADEVAKDLAQKRTAALNARLVETLAAADRAKGIDWGAPMVDNVDDGQKAYDRGQKRLENLKAEISGMKAELKGANAEVVELQTRIATGQYGNMGLEEVQKLTDELVQAQAEKEALDELMKGSRALDADITSARVRLANEEADLKTKLRGEELSEADKIRNKWIEGGYQGLGPNSPMQVGLRDITTLLNTTGTVTDGVGNALRNNAFGEQTAGRITTITDQLREMGNLLGIISTNANGISFGDVARGGAGFRTLSGPLGAGMRDLIGYAEGTDKGRGYNETLGYGAYTGGDRNLVGMTLNEILQLQKQMLAHPANGYNSSALGRYQIVSKTLKGLMEEMGLSGGELFNEQMQDAMADRLIARRAGQGVDGYRNEWEGLRRIDPQTILAALSGQNRPGAPTIENAKRLEAGGNVPSFSAGVVATAEQAAQRVADDKAALEKMLTPIVEAEARNKGLKGEVAIKNFVDGQINEIEKIKEEMGGTAKRLAATQKAIRDGKIIGDNRDPESAVYKEIIENAKKLDAVEAENAAKKKSRRQIERAEAKFEQQEEEIRRRAEEASIRMQDPLEKKSSNEFRQLQAQLAQHMKEMETFYGKDSAEYAAALERKKALLREFTNLEVSEQAAGWTTRAQEIRRSLMTEKQARQVALQEEIGRIDKMLADYVGSEEEKVQVVKAAEELKAQLRAQYSADDPISKKFREWGDLQDNLANATTGWMDSVAGGIAGLITGTGDFRSIVNGMINDIANMGVKYLMSSIMGGGDKGTKGTAKGVLKKGATKGIGTAHTGGIIGSSNLARSFVSSSLFATAPKFHTGGVIGGRSLTSDEVPIIAKKGEGVFTPEQMKALGGLNGGAGPSVSLSSSVTVNASGGSAEQNDDLAKKIGREVENHTRTIVVEEMRRQMRPGGILPGRGR